MLAISISPNTKPDDWVTQQVLRARTPFFVPILPRRANRGRRSPRSSDPIAGFGPDAGCSADPSRSDRAVLLLGDSFMAALQVEYEQSFAGLTETDLRHRSSAPIAVHNTAVPAWNPPHNLIAPRRLLPTERCALATVAVYLRGNDMFSDGLLPPRAQVQLPPFRFPRNLNRKNIVESIARPRTTTLSGVLTSLLSSGANLGPS